MQFANVNGLLVSNTCFKQVRTSRLWSWETSDGHTRNMIDHILVNSKWRGSVTNARVYPSADIGSDHQLMVAKIKLKLKGRRKREAVQRFDTCKLSDPDVADQYRLNVGQRLEPVTTKLTSSDY